MNPLLPSVISTIIQAVVPSGDEAATQPRAIVIPAPVRPIPAEALKATMRSLEPGSVSMSGHTLQMSPATQVRDEYNRLVLPGAIADARLVRFTMDADGAVQRVWILSAEESAEPAPQFR